MTDATLVHERADTPSATTAVTGRHLPALNGLRGVAVIGVVAYHLQLGWAKGGYLGVDLFFVLSGFLITTLLLEEWAGSGRINLAAFWGRRARRLLPALFLVVAALALYLVCNAVFGGPGANGLIDLSGLRGDAIATLLYVNNWHLIYAHQSYFAQFSTPSPLQHTWSLAIEEQFYLVWPLVLLVLLRFGRRGWRRLGVTLTVVLGVGSSVLMAVLFNPPADPSRIYYGTDTRLFDLMAGATLAFLAASRGQPGARARRTLHWVGPGRGGGPRGVLGAGRARPAGCPPTSCSRAGSCSAPRLAGLIVADARLVEPGSVRPCTGLAATALHRHHLLWDLPVALAGDRLPQRRPDRPVDRGRSTSSASSSRCWSRPPATTSWSARSAWPSGGVASGCGSPRWPASSPRWRSSSPPFRPSPIRPAWRAPPTSPRRARCSRCPGRAATRASSPLL